MSTALNWLQETLLLAAEHFAFQLLALAAPLIAIGLALHLCERIVQTRLATRFGWKSVLWTGWLGASVHELSHAAACLLFGHRIVEMALFQPDPQSGRLGYVRHAYNPANPLHVVGTLFIGLAPLAGGALLLAGLLWLFFPQAAENVVEARRIGEAVSHGRLLESFRLWWLLAWHVLAELFAARNLTSWKLWTFLYISLCVGSHMAPSTSDYRGALRGAVAVLFVAAIVNLVLAAFRVPSEWLAAPTVRMLAPVLALFLLCLLLCALSAVLTTLVTALFPRRYQIVRR